LCVVAQCVYVLFSAGEVLFWNEYPYHLCDILLKHYTFHLSILCDKCFPLALKKNCWPGSNHVLNFFYEK